MKIWGRPGFDSKLNLGSKHVEQGILALKTEVQNTNDNTMSTRKPSAPIDLMAFHTQEAKFRVAA